MKSNDFLPDSKQDNILMKIMPKYRPNSKAKLSPLATKEQNIRVSHSKTIKPLKTSQSDADYKSKSPPAIKNVRGGSCAKISASNMSQQSNSVCNKTNNVNNAKAGNKTAKVRFSKKVTVHYVPSDEERGESSLV